MRALLSWLFGTCEHFEVDEYSLLQDLKAHGYTADPRWELLWGVEKQAEVRLAS